MRGNIAMKVKIKAVCNKEIECDLSKIHKDKLGLHCECPFGNDGCGGTCDCELITPKYLYHCTDYSYKDSIIKDGLLLNKVKSLHDGKLIYFSLSPEYCYGNTCFKVDVDGLNVKSTTNVWEFVCSDDIPNDRIEYYGFEEIE